MRKVFDPGHRQTLFNLRRRDLHLLRAVFAVYILGFAYGTGNHIADILQDGLLGYTHVSRPVNFYWTLLTLLDPLAILLLLLFPLAGIALSVFIMASDIAVNGSVTLYYYLKTGSLSLDRLPLQAAFGVFVFLTAPYARRRLRKGRDAAGIGPQSPGG